VFRRRHRIAERAARVLVALRPRLFGQSIGHLLDEAGFSVVLGDEWRDELSGAGFDVLVVHDGMRVADAGLVVRLETGSVARVESNGESGLATIERPSDVVILLRALLEDEPGR
jgi:hypothetical protein